MHLHGHFSSILLPFTLVYSRHLHDVAKFKHLRAETSPAANSASQAASFITTGNAAISSIEDIQEGLSNLPGDLLTFIQALQDRLEAVEATLKNLAPGSSPVTATASSAAALSLGTSSIVNGSTGSTTFTLPLATHPPGPSNFTAPYANSTVTVPDTPPYEATTTFNPRATDNVAVYYGGAAPANTYIRLSDVCSQKIDIVVLQAQFDIRGSEIVSMWYQPCLSTTPGGDRLLNCTALSHQILDCQKAGKKVFFSIGQLSEDMDSFSDDEGAISLAAKMWSLFGGDTSHKQSRPFGDYVVFDGFEITPWCTHYGCNTPQRQPPPWDVLARALRKLFDEDASKSYYIASAPSCDTSKYTIPAGTISESDFVWPQFWNEPSCQFNKSNSSTVLQSLQSWWINLNYEADFNNGLQPRLHIGAAVYNGYPDVSGGDIEGWGYEFGRTMQQVRCLNLTNFGGIMLKDGPEAMVHTGRHGSELNLIRSAVKGTCPYCNNFLGEEGWGLETAYCKQLQEEVQKHEQARREGVAW
ncbi:Chitinase 3 [Pseudocercospora fuligena]|uniref:Chitinase 3 n=1 Tax=Pseudocercospora fuligena TaxID=685502 RepID=A0A8H6RR87_9PEZI|nr:Chitinase 3 [Pseudocercospora fuligena]